MVSFRNPKGDWTDLISVIPTLGLAWGIGYAYDNHRRRTAELVERAARLEREQATEARAAVAEERSRIAREMHDIVAHSLSVMVVQAEAAEAMLDVDPERARAPLSAVQDTGRTALTDLRRMLGALRQADEGGATMAPQPGLSELEALAAHVRDAGLPVELAHRGGSPAAAGRRRSLRLPDRAGGAHQRAQARRAGPGAGAGALRGRRDRARGDRRRLRRRRSPRERRARPGRDARAGGGLRRRAHRRPPPGAERGFALSARLPVEPGPQP